MQPSAPVSSNGNERGTDTLIKNLLVTGAGGHLGRPAGVTPTVETLTGRKPTSVREFLTAHREALTGE